MLIQKEVKYNRINRNLYPDKNIVGQFLFESEEIAEKFQMISNLRLSGYKYLSETKVEGNIVILYFEYFDIGKDEYLNLEKEVYSMIENSHFSYEAEIKYKGKYFRLNKIVKYD